MHPQFARRKCQDYLVPIAHHMHLKNFAGTDHLLGYCPAGQGEINITAILDNMEGHQIQV